MVGGDERLANEGVSDGAGLSGAEGSPVASRFDGGVPAAKGSCDDALCFEGCCSAGGVRSCRVRRWEGWRAALLTERAPEEERAVGCVEEECCSWGLARALPR